MAAQGSMWSSSTPCLTRGRYAVVADYVQRAAMLDRCSGPQQPPPPCTPVYVPHLDERVLEVMSHLHDPVRAPDGVQDAVEVFGSRRLRLADIQLVEHLRAWECRLGMWGPAALPSHNIGPACPSLHGPSLHGPSLHGRTFSMASNSKPYASSTRAFPFINVCQASYRHQTGRARDTHEGGWITQGQSAGVRTHMQSRGCLRVRCLCTCATLPGVLVKLCVQAGQGGGCICRSALCTRCACALTATHSD